MSERTRCFLITLLLAVSALVALAAAPAHAFHFPWDQGHDTFDPDDGDDDTDPGDDDPCQTGSPFQVATGNFIHTEQDFYLTALGSDIDVTRTYNSHDLRSGPFGVGWSFSLDQRIIETTDGTASFAICRSSSGKRERFTQTSGGGFTSPAYSSMNLTRGAGGNLSITSKLGIVRTFDSSGRLLTITDRNSNQVHFSYDATGFLSSVSDDAGRTFLINKGPNGKIASIVDPSGRVFSYAYDSDGHLIRAINPGGGITEYSYDSNHNLLSVTDPSGGLVQQLSYDSEGRLRTYLERGGTWTVSYFPQSNRTVKRDPLGNNWSLYYNDNGSIVRVVNPLGQSELRTYDARSNPSSITDKAGQTTSFEYDSADNLTRITDPVGNVTTITYDPILNLPTSITQPDGSSVTMAYDSRGNLVQFTDPLGNVARSTYDARGLRTSFTDSGNNTTSFAYDTFGYLTSATDALGRTAQFSLNVIGNLLSMTDPQAGTSSYGHDLNNHLVTYTDPLGQQTVYSYDAAGNMTTLRDPSSSLTTFDYDGFRRLTGVTDALGNQRAFSYDANGNLVSTTDAEGRTTTSTYDALDRVIRKATAEDTIFYFYDAVGNLTLISNNSSAVAFQYNALHQLVRATTAATAHQPAASIQYTYDSEGNRLSMVDPLGGTTTYQYDNLDRIARLTNPLGQSTDYSYDSSSRLIQVGLANGISSDVGYNSLDQLTSLAHRIGTTDVLSFDYIYDAKGRRVSMLDDAGAHSYTYDILDRLVAAVHPQAQSPDESFTYDPLGNRTASHLSASYTHDAANRLLEDDTFTYSYDRAGNLIRKTDKASGDQTAYSYNTANQLTGVTLPNGTSVSYSYDGLGRRIEKNVGGTITRYVYDGERILLEYDGTNAVTARYTHGPGIDEPISMERGGSTFFYLTDGLGSVRALTDGSGAIVQSYTYDSFGRIVDQVGSLENPFTFTGREFDSETGLYYLRSRYLDPVLGRFIQEDPLHVTATDINLYAYVANNPISFTDPMGLDWLENLSNFAAGFGDSLTFGLTDWIREKMGINDVVDKCSGFYKAGEYVEIGGEIVLTGGSALLKNAAKGASRRLVRNEFRRRTRGILRNGRQLHHVNPLFGHPGGASTLFPTGGLPGWIHSGRWNLKLLDGAAHTAAHRRLRQLEKLGKTVVNPATTAGRAGANALRDCDCK